MPDLLFKRVGRVPYSLHIGNEMTNPSDYRTDFSQVACSMHSVAIAKILCDLKKGITPKNVMCKGLLLFMKKVMLLYTLKATIGGINIAGLNISRSKLQCEDSDVDSLPPDFICAGISHLIEDTKP